MNRKPQAKAQASILVREMTAAGIDIKHQQALEFVARMNGFRDWNAMSGAAEEQPAAPAIVPQAPQQPKCPTEISITWSIYDVQSVCPHLTDAESYYVLREVQRKHDADQGINWDTLSETASWVYKHRILPCLITFEDENCADKTMAAAVDLTDDGKVFIEGRPLSELNPHADGEITFEALPGQEFTVEDGRIFGDEEDGSEEWKQNIAELVDSLDQVKALPDIDRDTSDDSDLY